MAKEKERKVAEHYYVEKGMTAQEVAAKVGVTPATLSKWVNNGGWKARREALATSAGARLTNLQELVSSIAEQRMQVSKELDTAVNCGDTERATELRKTLAAIDDGAIKWHKVLESAKNDATPSLSVYINVMEQVFSALRDYDEKLYLRTINFQDHHLNEISNKL